MKVISIKTFITVEDFEQWQVQYQNDNVDAPNIISIQPLVTSMKGEANADGHFNGNIEFMIIVQYWKEA